jgi:hypothetical protein
MPVVTCPADSQTRHPSTWVDGEEDDRFRVAIDRATENYAVCGAACRGAVDHISALPPPPHT